MSCLYIVWVHWFQGSHPSALTVLDRAVNGQRLPRDEDLPCTCCASFKATKKCSICHEVSSKLWNVCVCATLVLMRWLIIMFRCRQTTATKDVRRFTGRYIKRCVRRKKRMWRHDVLSAFRSCTLCSCLTVVTVLLCCSEHLPYSLLQTLLGVLAGTLGDMKGNKKRWCKEGRGPLQERARLCWCFTCYCATNLLF